MAKNTRKTCPTCAYNWLDTWDKDECPKCLNPLSSGGHVPRQPGEATTYKQSPGSAMESQFGRTAHTQCTCGLPIPCTFPQCALLTLWPP